jgi:putative PIN family toxin of toxin-antitoxin system
MRADRLVLDTNVIISALILSSPTPHQVVEDALAHSRLVVTESTERELIAVMMSPKFDKYVPQPRRQELLLRLAPMIERVAVIQIVRICRDPHDDAVLEAALNGRAGALVTGDKDLLELNGLAGLNIVTPAAYLRGIEDTN